MNAENEIHKIANEKEQKRSKVCQSNIVNNKYYGLRIKNIYDIDEFSFLNILKNNFFYFFLVV